MLLYKAYAAAIFFPCHPYIWSTTVLHDNNIAMEFKGFLLLLLGLLLSTAFASPDGNHSLQVCQPECPTWFIPEYNNGTMSCVCGDSLDGAVLCGQESNISLLYGYCMTYDEVNNNMASNYCPYHITTSQMFRDGM